MERSMTAPIGPRLRRIRRARDLTQEALATLSGLNVITISRLENGTAKAVYADTVLALADVLAVSADYLLGLSHVEEGGMQHRPSKQKRQESEDTPADAA